MAKSCITLKPSEQAVLEAAATIYAGYVTSGRAQPGDEKSWLTRSLREAIALAKMTDDSIQADGEFD